MADKPRYIKCPRCELNYILSNQDYCEVCKQEMKAGYQDELEMDEILMGDEESLCPICKSNYITDESKGMCESCYEENHSEQEHDENVDWKGFIDKDDNDEELDLLPIENDDDEIDEELGNAFAKDLEDEFDDDFDEEEEFNDFDDDDDFDDDVEIDDDDFDDDEEDEDDADDDDDDDLKM